MDANTDKINNTFKVLRGFSVNAFRNLNIF